MSERRTLDSALASATVIAGTANSASRRLPESQRRRPVALLVEYLLAQALAALARSGLGSEATASLRGLAERIVHRDH